MSTLCRAEPDWQRNVGQGNKTVRIRGFHSAAKFFYQFIFATFYVFFALLKYRVKGLERFLGFFEKNSGFIVKFRKFFGFIFFGDDGYWSKNQSQNDMISLTSLCVLASWPFEFPLIRTQKIAPNRTQSQ
jgi:hypothetical protein